MDSYFGFGGMFGDIFAGLQVDVSVRGKGRAELDV